MALKRSKRNRKDRRLAGKGPVLLVMLFYFLGFIVLFTRDGNLQALMMSVLVPAIVYVGTMGLPRLFSADQPLLALVNFLCALGVLILYRISPSLGMTQAVNYGAGVVCMIFCTVAVKQIRNWGPFCVLLMALAAVLLAAPCVIGEERNGAKAWITLGGYSLQPSEIAKVCLLPTAAFLLSRRKPVLSVLFAGGCMLLLMLQKDLGTALIYYFSMMILIYAATGSLFLMGCGVAGGAAAAVAGYEMFAHVKVRVAMWLDPWQDPMGKGYQIVKGLLAMVNGGLWGMGLGQGNATDIPMAQNDYILAVIMNEFGVIFGAMIALCYVLITVRGVMIATRAAERMYMLLAVGCVGMLAMQAFVIIGGVIKMIPLTGVTLPFISSGGSSMVSSLSLVGLVQGVSARNEEHLREDIRIARNGGDAH